MSDIHIDEPPKRNVGTYDHNDEHTFVYSSMGIQADDSPISRAWARLYDSGYNAGPAIAKQFSAPDGTEQQYFQYARASLDTSEDNINKTVVFHFGLSKLSESGL